MKKLIILIMLLTSINIFGQQIVLADTAMACMLVYSDSKQIIEPGECVTAMPSRYEIKEMPPLKAFRVKLNITFTKGAYTISAASNANMLEECDYELEDLLTGATFDMRKGRYSFHVNRNTGERFVMYIKPRVQKLVNSK